MLEKSCDKTQPAYEVFGYLLDVEKNKGARLPAPKAVRPYFSC